MIDTDKLVSLGIALVPTFKGLRYPALPNWQEMATTDLKRIEEWRTLYPDFNYVCVAKESGTLIVDIDDLASCKASGLPPVPQTFTVKSPKGYHLHLSQTEASRLLGNRDVKVDGAKILEVKCHNTAVAAPGCVREDGKQYIIYRDLPLAPLPQEWIDWITEHSQQTRRGSGRLRKFHPDFDAEELFRHYEWEFPSEFEKEGAMY